MPNPYMDDPQSQAPVTFMDGRNGDPVPNGCPSMLKIKHSTGTILDGQPAVAISFAYGYFDMFNEDLFAVYTGREAFVIEDFRPLGRELEVTWSPVCPATGQCRGDDARKGARRAADAFPGPLFAVGSSGMAVRPAPRPDVEERRHHDEHPQLDHGPPWEPRD